MNASKLSKNKIDSILFKINEEINKNFKDEISVGVLSGLSGILLFKFSYAKYTGSKFLDDFTESIFFEITERINRGEFYLTFCSGLAGFGWVLNYIDQKTSNLDIDIDEYLADIDDVLIIQMRKDIAAHDYDFLHGALGYGYYFLARFNNNSALELKVVYQNYIMETIRFLEDLAEESNRGIRWPMINNGSFEPKILNFGLAHGIPSIIFYLTEIYEAGISTNSCRRLINGGIKYLLNNKLPNPYGNSFFPTAIKEVPEYDLQTDSSRLAWCYGDLGIACVINKAANILKDEKLKSMAIAVMNHSRQRLDPKKNFVLDAPICHGAFGIAYIFQKFNLGISNIHFDASAEYWLDYGISFYDEYKMDGFQSLDALNNQYHQSLGILEGIAGIGLVLITFQDRECDTDWDKCLML